MERPPTHPPSPEGPCAIALEAALALVFPWAAVEGGLGATGFVAILALVGLVGLGWLHAIVRGGLGEE
jgi:NADH:ubiquinone oxidoreductase subunit 3 (subunit A)